MAGTPLNSADTAAPSSATGVVTINPGDKITNGVQYYNLGGTTYQNSQYQAPFSGDSAKSSSSVGTSSDAYGNAVDNLGNGITTAANTPPVINTGTTTVNSGYNSATGTDPQADADLAASQAQQKAEETQLQTERDQALQKLQTDQAAETTALTNTQNNETGSTTRNLLYLQQGGQSASAQAYLNKLSDTHTQEMNALSAKYQTAIQQAQNAYTDKDFALADKYAADAKTIKDDAYKRNQDFIDTTLKISADNRAQQTATYTQQKDQQTFNKDNKVSSRFYMYPGSATVFDSITGQPVTSDEYAKLGGAGQAGGYKDVQVIDPNASQQHSPAYVEYQDYLSSGGTPMSFSDYQTMDANRKARAGGPTAAETKAANDASINASLNSLPSYWKTQGYIQGNGKISSQDYITAKQQFVQKYGTDLPNAGTYFDNTMGTYVDRSGANYKSDYGIGI